MESEGIVKTIAYCGLICRLCFRVGECIELVNCNEGIYSDPQNPKVKACALCIHQDGVENLIAYVALNIRHGLSIV